MKRNRTASTRKRWLSLTLAIVLLFCPFPALAAEETPAEQTGDLGLAGKVKLGYHITWNQGKPLETGQTLVDLNYQFTLREAGSVADNARYWRIFVGDTAVFDCVYEVAFGTGSLSTGDTKCLSANAAVSGYVVTYTHTLTLDPGVTTFTLPALKIHYAAEPDALEEPSDTAVKDFTGTPITIAPPAAPELILTTDAADHPCRRGPLHRHRDGQRSDRDSGVFLRAAEPNGPAHPGRCLCRL